LSIQTQAIEIARQRLEFAIESLLTGRSTDTRNVVEAQTSLLQAQDGLENARASLQIAVLRYFRDTGLLRLDPGTGSLSQAMDRLSVPAGDGQEAAD
jgi:outer membrane protein TolC